MSDQNPWDDDYVPPPEIKKPLPSAPSPPPFLFQTENVGVNRLGMLAGNNNDVRDIVESPSAQKEARREAGRTPAEKQLLWTKFASEYLRDYNCELAFIRACAFIGKKPGKNAYKKGYAILRQPFVQMLIKRVVDELNEEELVTRKDVVMGLWKEANSTSEDANGGSRVRALMGLARIKQMDTKTVEKKVNVQNVMRVPIPADNDAWAAAAADSQRALKEDVRT